MMTNSDQSAALFYDRLTGRYAELPEVEGTLIGRWLVPSESGSAVSLNSADWPEGRFLVPDDRGMWTVVTGTGQRVEGSVYRQQLPEEIEAESLKVIGDRLQSLVQQEVAWQDWLNIVPLVPGMSEEIHPLPFELNLQKYFGHLESVCRKPRAHLHVELDRLPVSRARRIPSQSVNYLASHTEDWDGRLIRGVMPKRVLAEVRYDQLDIYENRVVARLLDHLLGYLNRRILQLKKLLKIFQEKEDYSSGAAEGTYLRQKRVMTLWGDAIDANECRKKAEKTLKELEKRKYFLLGLMDTPLYREVSRRTYVPTTLRSTNIFVNDPCYRNIADLWREWNRVGARKTKTAQQQNEEKQNVCRGMDQFTMLLVIRALDQLGYRPIAEENEEKIKPGVELHVRDNESYATLRWNEDGTLSLGMQESELRVVPLSVNLKGGKSETVARKALGQIFKTFQHNPTKILIAYAGDADKNSYLDVDIQRALHTVGNDPRVDIFQVGFLPVSPWEIGSTERVARALRWFLTAARFVGYPWEVNAPATILDVIELHSSGWLNIDVQEDNLTIKLKRPPCDYEWQQLSLNNAIEQAKIQLQESERRHERIFDELRRAVTSGRATAELNRQKSQSRREHDNADKYLKDILVFQENFKTFYDNAKRLLLCPICGSEVDPVSEFVPQDNGCFVCYCLGCKSRWETRMCGAGHKYPVLLPNGSFLSADSSNPGWEDRIYGGDILSLPARKTDGDWGFVCPDCGETS